MAILQRVLQASALLLSSSAAHAVVFENGPCAPSEQGYSVEMGEGMEVYNYNTQNSSTIAFDGSPLFTWAVKLRDGRLALCNEQEHKISIFTPGSETMVDVALGELQAPVGAVVVAEDCLNGAPRCTIKVWVACFGGDGGKSGIAVVDPEAGTLDVEYEFPLINGSKSFVHNIYAFQFDGKTDIYVAAFGNPWADPKVPGSGMVKFDRSTKKFDLSTTETNDMNARSIVQDRWRDDAFYVLEQIPGAGNSAVLNRLERNRSTGTFQVAAEALLPSRTGGDGGADVFLGFEFESVWVTDRITDGGKLYYYEYNVTLKEFNLMATYDTGKNPRYTTFAANFSTGDAVACNKDDGTISVFEGLMNKPTEKPTVRTVDSVTGVSFFIEVCYRKPSAPAPTPTSAPEPTTTTVAPLESMDPLPVILGSVVVAIVCGLCYYLFTREAGNQVEEETAEMAQPLEEQQQA